jgi:hypothetical protein
MAYEKYDFTYGEEQDFKDKLYTNTDKMVNHNLILKYQSLNVGAVAFCC